MKTIISQSLTNFVILADYKKLYVANLMMYLPKKSSLHSRYIIAKVFE